MTWFESLTLKDVPLFKNQTFSFQEGISVVYGLNKANGKSSRNANAAGKSYFFSSISDIAFGSPIVGEASDRMKAGTRRLCYTYKGKKIKIVRTGATKIKITVDGKALNARTAPIAKQYLAKLMPYSEEEFRTFVFQDSRVPHPLVMGTTAERKRFFTSFFKLDEIDHFRRRVSKELNELKQVRSAYNEVVSSSKLLQAELDDLSIDELQLRLKKVSRKLDKARDYQKEQEEIRRLLEFREKSKDQISLFLKLVPDASEDQLENTLNTLRDRLSSLQREVKLSDQWRQYEQDQERYQKATRELSKRARKELAFGYEAAIKSLEDKDVEYQKRKNEIRRIQSSLDNLTEVERPKRKAKDVDASLIDKLISEERSLKHQIDHARKFKSGSCPTCGQKVRLSSLSDLKSTLEETQLQLKKLQAEEDLKLAWKKYRTYKSERAELEAQLDDLPEISNPGPYLSELRSLPKSPEKPEGSPKDISELNHKIDLARDRIRMLEFFRPHLDTLAQAQALTEDQINQLNEEKYNVNDLTKRVASLTAKIEVFKNNQQKLDELTERKLKLKRKLKREEALTFLFKAYSDKAIKRLMINNISKTLSSTLNKYARLVFPEDYTFEFDFKTQFAILVHRKYGKRVSTSDVRKLSGAECKIFTLILILSMLTFIPPERRSSLLILDEPSANFSKETQEAFASLLPVLNKVIPCIVIITPKIEERYHGAKEFTVVKSLHGTSQILEGHPLDLKS